MYLFDMHLMFTVDVTDTGVVVKGNHLGMSFDVHKHFADNFYVAQRHFPVAKQRQMALSMCALHDAARGLATDVK